MQRSARPKSAKGKARPTPPSYPRAEGSEASSRASLRGRTGHGRTRQSSGASNESAVNSSSYQGRITRSRKTLNEEESNITASEPAQFPEVSRPVSSLSRYNILPRIPSTPGHGDGRVTSPVESELELDLMSSFAQQMILDSTKFNSVPVHVPKEEKKPSAPPKRGATNNSVHRHDPKNHDSPVHKKSRPSVTTRSVFGTRNSSADKRRSFSKQQEPKEGEPRLKLALKLPDGKRVERYFAPTNTISDIMNFAQTKMRIPIKRCNVYSMLQVPKVLLKSWEYSLEKLHIQDRTVLYIEEKD